MAVREIRNEILAKYSYIKTGGRANKIIFPQNEKELSEAVKAESENGKFMVIGNGTNLLFSDEGYEGTVIITTEMKEITVNGNTVKALCGDSMSAVATAAAKNALTGLEFYYGIPGSVGGAVYMNAGAYGGETSDVLLRVSVTDAQGNIFVMEKNEIKFSYRNSIFQHKKLYVISAEYVLTESDSDTVNEKMNDLMRRRREKQPLEYPSCGSFFKRPEGFFAGALIEQCGLKGFSVGNAAVSEKHAGFIINKGGATTSEILKLAKIVTEKVYEQTNVMLEPEVQII